MGAAHPFFTRKINSGDSPVPRNILHSVLVHRWTEFARENAAWSAVSYHRVATHTKLSSQLGARGVQGLVTLWTLP